MSMLSAAQWRAGPVDLPARRYPVEGPKRLQGQGRTVARRAAIAAATLEAGGAFNQGDEPPAYVDVAHLAFTIGMTITYLT